jgi:bacterioferritin
VDGAAGCPTHGERVGPALAYELLCRAGMRGDPEVIEFLNEVLTAELTAINQYFLHAKMLDNFGYPRLAKKKRDESIEEMKHADQVIARVLFLDGAPNVQRLAQVRIGDDPIEMHRCDLLLEEEAVARLNRGLQLAVAKSDGGTRALLEELLKDEEEAVDWLTAQLKLVETLGKQQYLSEFLEE